jgi:hypothetical protein
VYESRNFIKNKCKFWFFGLQKEVTGAQVQTISIEAIQAAKREHLELLAADTGIDLEEMDTGGGKCSFVENNGSLKS